MRDRKLEKVVAQKIRAALGAVRLEVLIILQDGVCAYDLGPIYPPYRQDVPKSRLATIDHVHPKSRGGVESPRNLVAASAQQNGRKGNLLPKGVWAPKFVHAPRDYRDVKGLVIHMRAICQGRIVARIRAGDLDRSMPHEQPITFMKIIRSEYEDIVRNSAAVPEFWALARVKLAHGAPEDSYGSAKEGRIRRGMAGATDPGPEKALKRRRRRNSGRGPDEEAGVSSGRCDFEAA